MVPGVLDDSSFCGGRSVHHSDRGVVSHQFHTTRRTGELFCSLLAFVDFDVYKESMASTDYMMCVFEI